MVQHARSADRLCGVAIRRHVSSTVLGDLAHLDEVVRIAETANRFGTFDAVIHNAGILEGPAILAVNVVAPYVLGALMHPPRRAIYLSSSMHRSGHANLDALEPAGRNERFQDALVYLPRRAHRHRAAGLPTFSSGVGQEPSRESDTEP